MKAERITLTIAEVCNKLGIDYSTINPHYKEMMNDAKRLGEIIWELNSLIHDLDAIFARHNIELKLKNILIKDLENLHEIDHDLVKLSNKIKNEKKL